MPSLRNTVSKVPEVTVVFWITKIMTTAMGESTSDYFVHTLGPVLAVSLGGVVFAAALITQFAVRRYIAGVYWFAVVMVSIFGTMVADSIHAALGVPYWVSTVGFAIILAAVFTGWRLTQKTLSIHSITSRPREFFYWGAVLSTFALGTAAGDFTASTLHLGDLLSGIMFGVIILLPLIAWWKLRLNAIFAFWFAYVTTRPLGASFADWFSGAHIHGGLGFGTGPVSLVLAVVILGLVTYLGISQFVSIRRAGTLEA